MKLHTVIVTHNRLELTQRTISSYLETVTVQHTLHVVDNASTDGTREWLMHEYDYGLSLFTKNRYPGYATNHGWSLAPSSADFLHRSDNDFEFLPGWCEQVEHIFRSKKVGQVGLRTSEEEAHEPGNTGGNCVIRRSLWDAGLRWDERSWPVLRRKLGPGITEDSLLSPAVVEMGYTWTRVKKPAIRPTASGDWSDEYYRTSYGIRGITPRADDPTVPDGFVPYAP